YCYDSRKHTDPDAERDIGILYPFDHFPRGDLCFRYYRRAKESPTSGGGRDTISLTNASKEQRVVKLYMEGIKFWPTAQILSDYRGRAGRIISTGHHVEGACFRGGNINAGKKGLIECIYI